MYFYIIDSFIKEKRYAKIYHRMSMRLNDLGIFDDKIQVTKVRPIEDIVRDVLSNRSVKQIIAVGNDSTASQVINAICKNSGEETSPAFGVIPFQPSDIAQALGFPNNIEEACNMISRRKIDKIDVGKANKDYFLTSLSISQANMDASTTLDKFKKFFIKQKAKPASEVEIKLNNYKLVTSAEAICILNIYNNFWKRQIQENRLKLNKIGPHDGLGNLLIAGNYRKENNIYEDLSFFTAKNMAISSRGKIFAYLDNTLKTKVPIDVTIKMKYFNTLLGKNRNF